MAVALLSRRKTGVERAFGRPMKKNRREVKHVPLIGGAKSDLRFMDAATRNQYRVSIGQRVVFALNDIRGTAPYKEENFVKFMIVIINLAKGDRIPQMEQAEVLLQITSNFISSHNITSKHYLHRL